MIIALIRAHHGDADSLASDMPAFGDVTGAYLGLHKLQRGTKQCAERNGKVLT